MVTKYMSLLSASLHSDGICSEIVLWEGAAAAYALLADNFPAGDKTD